MKEYRILNLMTGRIDKDREGNEYRVRAFSERGAKARFTRAGLYRDWNLYTVQEV